MAWTDDCEHLSANRDRLQGRRHRGERCARDLRSRLRVPARGDPHLRARSQVDARRQPRAPEHGGVLQRVRRHAARLQHQPGRPVRGAAAERRRSDDWRRGARRLSGPQPTCSRSRSTHPTWIRRSTGQGAPPGTIFDPASNSLSPYQVGRQHRRALRAAVHVGDELHRERGLDVRCSSTCTRCRRI